MAETLKQEAKRLLADVPGEYVFRSHNGNIIHNMKELADEFKTMMEGDYAFHVNEKNNDFINWVRDTIKDERLVKDLQSARNQAEAAKLVTSRVSILSRRLA